MIMERKRILLAAVVWALMLLSSVCQSQENQIINGEFDAGIEPWQKSVGDGFTIEVVQGEGLSGTYALKIDVLDTTAQESILISRVALLLNGEPHIISALRQKPIPTDKLACCSNRTVAGHTPGMSG
jgi:hypothetical protein